MVLRSIKKNSLQLLDQYPAPLVRALGSLTQRRSPCYITGGTVRDWLLGLRPEDLDITVAHDGFRWAAELAGELGGTFVPMDEEEDVARMVWQGIRVDFSSFREGAQTIEEDLLKRDFTINSLAVPFPDSSRAAEQSGEPAGILDPAQGLQDLRDGIIRCTSAAAFVGDPLRMLRAYRFMAKFRFRIEPLTESRIREHIHLLYLAAEERIAGELDSIMAVPGAITTFEAMHGIGLLEELLPELYTGVGVKQPASHHLDVFEHGLAALRHMEKVQQEPGGYFPGHEELLSSYLRQDKKKILLKWAALFHDLGKPATHAIREDRNGRITFYNHDKKGADIFALIAHRFKWSRHDREFVSRLVSLHMWPFHLNNARRKTGLTPRAYLRLIKAVGREFPGLFMLAMADSLAGRGTGKPPGMEEDINGLFSEVEKAYRQTIEPVLTKRLLTGHDLIDVFGLEPGPEFRKIFDRLEKAQVAGEVLSRKQALDWVRNYLRAKT